MSVADARLRVETPPERPVLLFDGGCGSCQRWVARARVVTGDRVAYVPSAEGTARFPEIPPARYAEAVQWVGTDGVVEAAAAAVFRALGTRWALGWLPWAHRWCPPFRWAAEAGYRWMARHRTTACPVAPAPIRSDVPRQDSHE